MITIKKFLAIGALTLSAGLMLSQLSHMNTLNDFENINESIYSKVYDNQEQEVRKYVQKDISFLKTISPEIISDLNIIVKDKNGLIDRMAYTFTSLKYKISKSEEDKNHLDYIAGNVSLYNKSNFFGKDYYTLVLGVNMVENPSKELDGLFLAFNGDKEKINSFILFHELSHHIFTKKNYEKTFNELITNIEQHKDIIFSKHDKEIMHEQFNESFADSIAIQLIQLKYPTLNINNIKKIISGWRLDESLKNEDFEHITSVALESLNISQEPEKNFNNIMENALESAHMALKFSSDIESTEDKKGISTLDKNTQDKITDNIQKMRDYYLEQQSKTIKHNQPNEF